MELNDPTLLIAGAVGLFLLIAFVLFGRKARNSRIDNYYRNAINYETGERQIRVASRKSNYKPAYDERLFTAETDSVDVTNLVAATFSSSRKGRFINLYTQEGGKIPVLSMDLDELQERRNRGFLYVLEKRLRKYQNAGALLVNDFDFNTPSWFKEDAQIGRSTESEVAQALVQEKQGIAAG